MMRKEKATEVAERKKKAKNSLKKIYLITLLGHSHVTRNSWQYRTSRSWKVRQNETRSNIYTGIIKKRENHWMKWRSYSFSFFFFPPYFYSTPKRPLKKPHRCFPHSHKKKKLNKKRRRRVWLLTAHIINCMLQKHNKLISLQMAI